ncbi:protein GlxC [Pelagibius sp. Alg239-R121]|uniref:GltB/FmdC/FwdC-like GXGXG domain-containing protein n=1 Tax=Pelagibius sp. Alg239-R121 TaxID=2993448 RepID=UPI0024A6AB4B|nr:protein GlxC [Pelagibius sp. Alg239-R121]
MASGENIEVLDLALTELRDVNARLQGDGASANGFFRIINPRGAHALACGLDNEIEVEVEGHTGYYCAGMNQKAKVVINGNAGQGVAENMMSGEVRVTGDVSQSAGATAHGGLLVIEGNAAARCGISLKGGDIVVKGNVGHMSMFMAQAGTLVVLGDAGDALGDSLYEAQIYVRGSADNLGADCIEKEMRAEHHEKLRVLLEKAGCSDVDVSEFKRYGSARALYNFKPDNVDAY